jgi:hypothetical protein
MEMKNHKIHFISKNSLDWPLKRQCQTTKSIQFLCEVEIELTLQSVRAVTHSPGLLKWGAKCLPPTHKCLNHVTVALGFHRTESTD